MAIPAARHFELPDLVRDCHYGERVNPHCVQAARESEKWLIDGAGFSETKEQTFMGLMAGELTASCYPDADFDHLRVCDDFMNYLFNLDDWLDEFDENDTDAMGAYCIGTMRDPENFVTEKIAGKKTKDFFLRLQKTAGPGCKERFIHTMDLFFKAVHQQAKDRREGVIPDLESYITMRRDTSGCKPCFALIEACLSPSFKNLLSGFPNDIHSFQYAGCFDLPKEVIQNPAISAMEEATNDLVTWSNDLFSYNKEQVKGDTHNMISVMMQQGKSLQEAVNFVGEKSSESIEKFERERQNVPSWGPELDKQVAMYIDGLQNWIVGSLHWSFRSKRYFGDDGARVKVDRHVELLPQMTSAPAFLNVSA